MKLIHSLIALSLIAVMSLCTAKPTESRVWKSTAGTSLEARAKTVEGDIVVFETADGRIVRVPLDKLVEEDRTEISNHFPDTIGNTPGNQEEIKLAHPLGKTIGPITANGSNYFVYLPTSLKAGGSYPLVFYTGATGGVARTLEAMKEGAEICGWIVACSVESKNAIPNAACHVHSKNSVDDLCETLPIDRKRIYFSGNSGGARVAFLNAEKMKAAGVIALIAGAREDELQRGRNYFFITGSNDYNRYEMGYCYNKVKRTSAFRFHGGSHSEGPGWLMTEAIVWQEARWQNQTRNAPTRIEFENAVGKWVNKLLKEDENRAAWWIAHFNEEGMRAKFPALPSDAASLAAHDMYIKGIAALESFAATVMADGPRFAPGCLDHTSPEIQKKADALLETYGSDPWFKKVLEGIKRKTVKG